MNRKAIIVLLCLALCCTAGCKGKKDTNLSKASSNVQSSEDMTMGVNPPADLASNTGDVNFGLTGPGDPDFDKVSLDDAVDNNQEVGEVNTGGNMEYIPPTSSEDESLPDLSVESSDVPIDASSTVELSTDSETVISTPEVPKGGAASTISNPLPNMGIFLEDDY